MVTALTIWAVKRPLIVNLFLQTLVKETQIGKWAPEEFRVWYVDTVLLLLPAKSTLPPVKPR